MWSLQLGVASLKVVLQHSMSRTNLMLIETWVLQHAANFMLRFFQEKRIAGFKVVRQISNHNLMSQNSSND